MSNIPGRLLFGCLCVSLALPVCVKAQRAENLPDRFHEFIVTDSNVIAIKNIRLIDGKNTPAVVDRTIIISDGRIIRIGDSSLIEEGFDVIDGGGLTALPGLVMMHEHLSPKVNVMAPNPPYLLSLLGHGVTTARTAGTPSPMLDLGIKRLLETDRLIGPDLDVTSPFISTPSWVSDAFPMLPPHDYETQEEIRLAVRYWANRGVTSFKAFMGLAPEQLRVLVDEVHAHGLKIAAHLCVTTATEAAEIGIDSLEHGLLFMKELYSNKSDDTCPRFREHFVNVAEVDADSANAHAVINVLRENGVAVTPTLATWSTIACPSNLPRDAAKHLLTDEEWQNWSGNFCQMPEFIGMSQETRLRMLRNAMDFAKSFHDAGGLLLAGSDDIPGLSSLFELQLLVQAGLTPLEAIRAATYNGAHYLGRLENIGTLEVGKRADILLVRGRPDENIADIRNVVTVFKDGIGYDSKALIDSIAGKLQL